MKLASKKLCMLDIRSTQILSKSSVDAARDLGSNSALADCSSGFSSPAALCPARAFTAAASSLDTSMLAPFSAAGSTEEVEGPPAGRGSGAAGSRRRAFGALPGSVEPEGSSRFLSNLWASIVGFHTRTRALMNLARGRGVRRGASLGFCEVFSDYQLLIWVMVSPASLQSFFFSASVGYG